MNGCAHKTNISCKNIINNKTLDKKHECSSSYHYHNDCTHEPRADDICSTNICTRSRRRWHSDETSCHWKNSPKNSPPRSYWSSNSCNEDGEILTLPPETPIRSMTMAKYHHEAVGRTAINHAVFSKEPPTTFTCHHEATGRTARSKQSTKLGHQI